MGYEESSKFPLVYKNTSKLNFEDFKTVLNRLGLFTTRDLHKKIITQSKLKTELERVYQIENYETFMSIVRYFFTMTTEPPDVEIKESYEYVFLNLVKEMEPTTK